MKLSLRAVVAPIIIGAAAAAGAVACTSTHTVTTPGPTVNHTQTVPVPGPTVTQTVPAPAPPQGSTLDTFHGTGNEVTPQFNVPSDGNYILTWSYSGNIDSSFGSSDPTNFSIMPTGDGFGDTPNDIAASGQGSTEVTGADSHDSLNVEAVGSWTITIKST